MTNSTNDTPMRDKALQEQGQVDTAKNLSSQYSKAKTQRKAIPSTLMSIVDALEASQTTIGVRIGNYHGFLYCSFPGDDEIKDIRVHRTKLRIRLAFERAGYKPVSDKLLYEALQLSKFQPLNEGGW